MIHKYNLIVLQERFDLTWDEIKRFIKEDLLLPIGWHKKSYREQQSLLNSGTPLWDLEEVQRFERVINLVRDKHLMFYRMVNTRMNEDRANSLDEMKMINTNISSLKLEILELKSSLSRREVLIDAVYFCHITGYKIQTFRNKIKKNDETGLVARLMIPFYKDLFWHKIKGKWQTPLQDFLELRSGFIYDLYLDEKKRKGEFQPGVKIDRKLLGIE